MRIMLAGNPNCGKTSVFNALTGGHQRVGNWSGVTVALQSGTCRVDEVAHELVDLPGVYTLDTMDASVSQDEDIAVQALHSGAIDRLINVVDACHLERHLYLTSQLLELGFPMVIALTMMDRAEKQGIWIDTDELSRQLGCLVVVVHAPQNQGLEVLKRSLIQSSSQPNPLACQVADEILAGPDGDLFAADARYTAVHQLVERVQHGAMDSRNYWTNRLDRIVLHRWFAIPFFFCMMYALFFVCMQGGGFLQHWCNQLTDTVFIDYPRALLLHLKAPDWVIACCVNGVGRGISTTLTFIPVMSCMFLSLAVLDASGYMARAAFVMDRAMRYLGLPGKAFVPMIIGFGCNVPAVLAARTLTSSRERWLTILMTPFMSCSARLAIYAVFVAAFFPHGGHNVVFSLYCMGIFMGVLTGYLLRRTLFSGPVSPLLLELPVYHLPSLRRISADAVRRLRAFIVRAGALIIPVSTVLGALSTYSMQGHLVADSAQSIIAWIGQHVVFVFAPMGITADNWPAAVGLIMGTLAKEVVVGSLSSLYSGIDTSQGFYGALVQRFDGQIGAYAYLLFVLLYMPCVSTMAVIRQETNRKLMWFSIGWSTVLAYSIAVIFYQLATFMRHPEQSLAYLVMLTSLLGFIWWCIGYVQQQVAEARHVTSIA